MEKLAAVVRAAQHFETMGTHHLTTPVFIQAEVFQ